MAEIDDIRARLDLLEAEREVLRNLHRYAQCIDYGDEAGWVDCFTEDGVFDIRPRLEGSHQPDRLISGREELRAFIARHTRAPELWHKHMIVEPLIDVDLAAGTATCSCYLFVLMENEDAPVLRVFGRYRDELAKGADGRWRFARRIAEVESMRKGLPPFVDGRPGPR
ncbi:MAG: nuclear transport factor 2 family protein [Actinobacteria bacterium]|nr:nuclear transport factor 2 family protein [Actinomycetota bacterium]